MHKALIPFLTLSLFLTAQLPAQEPPLLPVLGALPAEMPPSSSAEWTLQQCVLRGLEANYEVAIREWSITNAEASVLSERGAFEPRLSGEVGRSNDSDTNVTTETDNARVALHSRFVTGTELSLFADYNKDSHADDGRGGVGAELKQPLLKGFGLRYNQASLTAARRNATISRHEFEQQLIDTAREIEALYWRLVLARERLAVQEASLESARELETLTVQRADARLVSQSDIVEAQAAVYDREASVVRAGEEVRIVEDSLKDRLALFEDASHWTETMIPATPPEVSSHDVGLLNALKVSLEHRPDYQAELLRLKNLDLALYVAKNRLLPQLDLVASGERFESVDSVGRTFDAASRSDDEIWSVFLRLEIPLGNKKARAESDQAYAAKEQQLLRIRQFEMRIIHDIRRSIDSLQTSRRLVAATQKAMEFEQRKLDNERIKLDLGKSTTDNNVRFIQSLNQARLNHVQAVVDYCLAWSRLAQVQGITLQQYELQVEYDE